MRYLLPSLLLAATPVQAFAQDTVQADGAAYLDEALDVLQARHYLSEQADWSQLREDAADMLEAEGGDIAAARVAISEVIERLGERHSFLRPARPMTAGPTPRRAEESGGNTQTPAEIGQVPVWRAVDGGIGYAVLPGLDMREGGQEYAAAYHAELREALQEMGPEARCGWIIDIRGNTGGNMWPMLWGLDPLLGEGPFGYFISKEKRIPWVRGGPDAEAPILADTETRYPQAPAFAIDNADRPVAVLLGSATVSSGEMVALALAGREDVAFFGEPTGGLTTANITHRMPDGASLVVTVSRVAGRDGEIVTGPLQPDFPSTGEQAPYEARDWLLEQCAFTGQ